MNNNLRNIEKTLKSLAKKYNKIKYSKNLLFYFLISGSFSVAYGSEKKEENINKAREQIVRSIDDMKTLFKQAKRENNKLLKDSNMELIQLMEQGDNVIKSPWSSWQFGVNYFYNKWRGSYLGLGDKTEKYSYEGMFTRGDGG